ncbi:hypothetical protein BJX64DRAFT_269256 [Aspergillus heterothallicus]
MEADSSFFFFRWLNHNFQRLELVAAHLSIPTFRPLPLAIRPLLNAPRVSSRRGSCISIALVNLTTYLSSVGASSG